MNYRYKRGFPSILVQFKLRAYESINQREQPTIRLYQRIKEFYKVFFSMSMLMKMKMSFKMWDCEITIKSALQIMLLVDYRKIKFSRLFVSHYFAMYTMHISYNVYCIRFEK